MLGESLKAHAEDRVPPDARRWLDEHRTETLKRSVYLTGRLVGLVGLFEKEKIPALPFKGPTLAAFAYGDLGLREFFDLDILVRPGDVSRATAALVSVGFTPQIELSIDRQQAFVESENALQFRRSSDRCLLELHWALTPKYLPFHPDPESVWRSPTTTRPGGTAISTMGAERLVLFLCVHGAKHCWESLAWICDIARLVSGPVPLDWDGLFAEAALCGSQRMLLVGLLLARNLLGARLPDRVDAKLDADPHVHILAREVGRYLARDSHHPMGTLSRMRVHLRMRERVRDKLKYAVHMALTPSVRDYETFRLPKYLSFFYRPMRPFRLLREYTAQGRRS